MIDDTAARRDEALQEMMRLARSIVADGEVSDMEAKVFHAWIERNAVVKSVPAVEQIVRILTNVFADGKLSEGERSQLLELLAAFGG